MSTSPNIFKEESKPEVDYQGAYDAHQELLELTCRVALLKKAKDNQWRFTKTDARNLALAFLDTRQTSEANAAKGRALIRKIYEDKLVNVTELSQASQESLEQETRKINELFQQTGGSFKSKTTGKFWIDFTLMDVDQYIQVVNLAFLGKKKNDRGILIALPILDIDISSEHLLAKSKELPALRKEVKQLMTEYDQYQALRKGPDQIIKRLEEVDEQLTALSLWKKHYTKLIAVLVILVTAFVALSHFTKPQQSDSAEKSLLPLVLSEGIPLLQEDQGENLMLVDESIAQQQENAYQISLKLINYDKDVKYYLDAVLLARKGIPARVASAKSAIADKAHFFLEDEAKYYSIRFLASSQMGSEIPPRHSKFMEILVSGESKLEGLELEFDISIVVHDQFTNSDTINVAPPYSVIF